MALREIKTNIQKWETKDEPQTNGSYKITQIIIKIMEYTYIHIYPWAKSQQSNKNTVDWSGKQRKSRIIFTSYEQNWNKQNWKTKLKQGAKWGIKQWKHN